MPRRATEPTRRCHVWLFASDWQWLVDNYEGTLGTGTAVRTIIRAFRNAIEAEAQARADGEPETEIDVRALMQTAIRSNAA